MFGCLRRLGCLIVLVVALLFFAFWYWNNRRDSAATRTGADTAAVSIGWEPLTADRAERGRRAVQSLGSGRQSATLTAGEAASYIFQEATRQLPPAAQDARASVSGDRLLVRANMSVAEIGGSKVLGPLAGFFGERDTVQLAGTLSVVRPGVGQFRVREIRLGERELPGAFISPLVRQLRRGTVPPGTPDDAFPMPFPQHISDVRIARGRITIYRDAP